jgi:hypothetical protein
MIKGYGPYRDWNSDPLGHQARRRALHRLPIRPPVYYKLNTYVGTFHGNLPLVPNIDNRPTTVLFRKSPLLCNSR